jgi:hypothetical protein
MTTLAFESRGRLASAVRMVHPSPTFEADGVAAGRRSPRRATIALDILAAAALVMAGAFATGCGGSAHRAAARGTAVAATSRRAASGSERSSPPIRVTTVRGSDGPGPSKYDRVRVVEVGPSSARHVLVLEPGTSAGAGSFVPDAEWLVGHLDGWQVWAVDRRENLLEDHSILDRARAGGVGGRQLFDYYLGWLGDPAVTRHYEPPADDTVAFARRWGMRVAVGDLHRVLRAARKGGRRVVLGGHSLGGWISTAYATWDFGGRAGARDLDGLVLIDGASGGPAIGRAEARQALADLHDGSPFLGVAGARLPWIAGALAAVSSTLALREPDAPSLLQAWPLLPSAVKPPVPVTNRALFGYTIDVDTSSPSLAAGQAHLGGLASEGEPRGFEDGGYATVERTARALNGVPGADGAAWLHPRRLSIDANAVAGGVPAPAQALLGVHATHGRDVHVPIYAIETSFLRGRILTAARALAMRSHVPSRRLTLVDRSRKDAHSDPLFDNPASNDFLRTVLPFLRRVR